jgi:hypothetical protein
VLNGHCQGIVTYSSGNVMHQYVSPNGDRLFTYRSPEMPKLLASPSGSASKSC